MIDNRGALVLKLLTDFFFLFFFLLGYIVVFSPPTKTKKKKNKKQKDMALLPLTKIKTPINLDAMALLPPIKNTHRAEWILNIGIPSKTMYYNKGLSLSAN